MIDHISDMILEHLELWLDPEMRDGAENMAVDEWLMNQSRTQSLLRIYRWQGNWGTLGYFGNITAAQASIPELRWVRRWTGGGTVDHRADWTYSLFIPDQEKLAKTRGTASYAWIHQKLHETLHREGLESIMCQGELETGNAMCFDNPVDRDLVAADGTKLAGAGQRRSKMGLLHQGSVAVGGDLVQSTMRGRLLAELMAKHVHEVELFSPHDEITYLCRERYANPSWTQRR